MLLREAKQILKKAGYLMEAGRNTRFKRNVVNFDELDDETEGVSDAEYEVDDTSDNIKDEPEIEAEYAEMVKRTKSGKVNKLIKLTAVLKKYIGKTENGKYGKNTIKDVKYNGQRDYMIDSVSILVNSDGISYGEEVNEDTKFQIIKDDENFTYKLWDDSEQTYVDEKINWESNDLDELAKQIIKSIFNYLEF